MVYPRARLARHNTPSPEMMYSSIATTEGNHRSAIMKPGEELAGLRQLLKALESGSMTMRENGKDVTKREIDKLKPDIAFLEKVLARKS